MTNISGKFGENEGEKLLKVEKIFKFQISIYFCDVERKYIYIYIYINKPESYKRLITFYCFRWNFPLLSIETDSFWIQKF